MSERMVCYAIYLLGCRISAGPLIDMSLYGKWNEQLVCPQSQVWEIVFSPVPNDKIWADPKLKATADDNSSAGSNDSVFLR